MAGPREGLTSDPSWRTERGCSELPLAFCERGCPPPWCPEMGSLEHRSDRDCPQICHGTLRGAALIPHGATKGGVLKHGALRGQPAVPPPWHPERSSPKPHHGTQRGAALSPTMAPRKGQPSASPWCPEKGSLQPYRGAKRGAALSPSMAV